MVRAKTGDEGSAAERGAEPPKHAEPWQREVLLSARVSNIIDSHEDALATLIDHGFTLLAQAPLRWAMAHTVNLGQAFRLRGLSDQEQEALIDALAALGVPAALAASGGTADGTGSES